MAKLRPLLLLVGILLLLSPLASSAPDGLEWVAERLGFAERAAVTLAAPVPDYAWPGINHGALATILAGLVGAVLVLAAGWGLARLLVRR